MMKYDFRQRLKSLYWPKSNTTSPRPVLG